MPRSVLLVVVAMVPRVPVVLVSVVVGHAAYIDDAVGGQRGDDRRVRIQQDASKVDAAEKGWGQHGNGSWSPSPLPCSAPRWEWTLAERVRPPAHGRQVSVYQPEATESRNESCMRPQHPSRLAHCPMQASVGVPRSVPAGPLQTRADPYSARTTELDSCTLRPTWFVSPSPRPKAAGVLETARGRPGWTHVAKK